MYRLATVFGLTSAQPTPQGLSGAPWNLNYDMDVIKDDPRVVKAPEEVVKEAENVVKAKTNVTKEFVKAYSGDIRSLFWLLSLPSLPNQRYNV